MRIPGFSLGHGLGYDAKEGFAGFGYEARCSFQIFAGFVHRLNAVSGHNREAASRFSGHARLSIVRQCALLKIARSGLYSLVFLVAI